MASQTLLCPTCRTRFRAEDGAARRHALCPNCGRAVPLPAAADWYFTRDRQRYGPVGWEQLRRLAERGALRPDDLVWRRGAAAWVAASSVPGLLPQTQEAPEAVRPEDDDLSGAAVCDGPTTAAEPERTPRTPPARPPSFGDVTLHDFQILKKIGAGAMGAVYLARRRGTDRLVALKVLSRHLSARPASVQRFTREAEIMSHLDHPSIVRLHAAGADSDLYFLAMDYVDGCSAALVSDRLGVTLPVGDALYVVLRCAEALRYALKEHQVIHRDVKPTNILLNCLGYVKLTDLGLAKPLSEDTSLTESGVCLGTPEYMAPEQMRNAKYADHRSDIYALGGVLYRLLTGKLPFHQDGQGAGELLLAKEQGIFTPARRFNPEVPPRLNLLLDRMLTREVRHRFQSYDELIDALRELGLANEHLSFNLLRILRPAPAQRPPGDERVEVLLVDDDAADVLLVQEGLDESGIPSNLNVVADGAEALAFLGRQGRHEAAPRPHLILLGRGLLERGAEVVAAIKSVEAYRRIPLVVLTTSTRAVELLRGVGVQVHLKVSKPGELQRFQELLDRGGDSTVTVVELMVE